MSWRKCLASRSALFLMGTIALSAIMSSVAMPSIPKKNSQSCVADRLTVYRVIMNTYWSQDDFPKHYPLFRPAAQFSKLIGKCPIVTRCPRIIYPLNRLMHSLSVCCCIYGLIIHFWSLPLSIFHESPPEINLKLSYIAC